VPEQNCKKLAIPTTVPSCAKRRGTLLFAYTNTYKPKTGCAKCARGFFLSQKKIIGANILLYVAQLPIF